MNFISVLKDIINNPIKVGILKKRKDERRPRTWNSADLYFTIAKWCSGSNNNIEINK